MSRGDPAADLLPTPVHGSMLVDSLVLVHTCSMLEAEPWCQGRGGRASILPLKFKWNGSQRGPCTYSQTLAVLLAPCHPEALGSVFEREDLKAAATYEAAVGLGKPTVVRWRPFRGGITGQILKCQESCCGSTHNVGRQNGLSMMLTWPLSDGEYCAPSRFSLS